jgi:hypothetical protein
MENSVMNSARIDPKTEQYLMVPEFFKQQRFVTEVMECGNGQGGRFSFGRTRIICPFLIREVSLCEMTDLQFEEQPVYDGEPAQ